MTMSSKLLQRHLWEASDMISNSYDPEETTSDSLDQPSQIVADFPEMKKRLVRSIQDLLLNEGLLAARLSAESNSIAHLQEVLIGRFGQNSQETRKRYAQSVLKWFFPDGINGIVRRSWLAYGDESIELDLLRYLYLNAEPIIGSCVAEALFPLEEGMFIPSDYFDRFLYVYLVEVSTS